MITILGEFHLVGGQTVQSEQEFRSLADAKEFIEDFPKQLTSYKNRYVRYGDLYMVRDCVCAMSFYEVDE